MSSSSIRSKTGCYTCRSAKKKCPEDFDGNDGRCSRCARQDIHCERSQPVRPRGANPQRPRSSTSSSFPPPDSLEAAISFSSNEASQAPQNTFPAAPFVPVQGSSADLDVQLDSASPHFPSEVASPTLFQPWASMVNFLVEPDASFQVDQAPFDWSFLTAGIPTPASGDASTTSPASAQPQASQEELVADFSEEMVEAYARINLEWLSSLPSAARETAARRWRDLAVSSQLGRAAAGAIVTLYIARNQAVTASEGKKKELLAVSDRYFQQAVVHLADSLSLEAQLNALLDLYYHQLDVESAAAGYALLAVGEVFLIERLGVHPTLNLATLTSTEQLPLRLFACIDVFRSIAQADRPTLFNLPLPTPSDPTPLDTSSASTSYLGLPLHLLPCLAATSNLAARARAVPPTVTAEELAEEASRIENAIKKWRAISLGSEEGGEDSMAVIADLATKEMWRHSALLHLYQAVLRLGCLASCVRHSLRQILTLGSCTATPSRPVDFSAGALRAFPFFLAATVAITEDERKACRAGLSGCGKAKVYEDNRRAAELLWKRMDRTGREGDWREILRDEGLCVAFM
ncbi:hypothetical protein JCM8547_001662 [Rhodosporidiobolus lusitaniae]